MRVVLVADAFPPMRTSAAVQLRDLALEFAKQGYDITILIPSSELEGGYSIDYWRGVRIVRLKAPRTKDIGYVRRTINEFLMPFSMLSNLRKSPLANEVWDCVVWYSPTIFLGPMASSLKRASDCKSYLIIRDIFPEWAADMGLMGRGLPYFAFKAIAAYQYSVADVIGVQTAGNLTYFSHGEANSNRRLEVLQNWLAPTIVAGCSIQLNDTVLAGRRIFVYAGNMGVAQGMGILLDLAECLKLRHDVGFVFVGRGSDAPRLRADAVQRGLDNVLFFDEIDPDDIPGLYEQCDVGLVSLDSRHKTHNIPGKFLSYMHCGLPVLASINEGNDLVQLIKQERVGVASTDMSADTLANLASELVDHLAEDDGVRDRCKSLADRLFSSEAAVRQIIGAMTSEGV